LKILHFYKTFAADQHGGVEHFIRHLTHATSSLGCENTILSLAREPSAPLVTKDYRLFQVKESANLASTGMSVSAFSVFSSMASEADVIHYHFPWPFMDLVHVVSRVAKPSVVTYHSDIVRQRFMLPIYWPLMNMFLRSVNAIAGTSPNYLDSSRVLRKFRDKSLAIPIGLQESLYPAASASTTAELKTRFGDRFFLFVGVLRYYKGLHFLLQALEGTDLPMVIVGAGPIENELREEAARLGLTNINFIGQVTEQEKVDLFNACYAVVFPSHLRSEAFGIGLLEGAMFGKPMICSEIGTGTSFINQHEVTGLVVPPANAQALKGAMMRLWNHSEEAASFGEAARQRFLEVFSAQVMGEAYSSLYESVLR
jgi:glycosyltransferase involved in cell wall biosynthesis